MTASMARTTMANRLWFELDIQGSVIGLDIQGSRWTFKVDIQGSRFRQANQGSRFDWTPRVKVERDWCFFLLSSKCRMLILITESTLEHVHSNYRHSFSPLLCFFVDLRLFFKFAYAPYVFCSRATPGKCSLQNIVRSPRCRSEIWNGSTASSFLVMERTDWIYY